MIDNTANRWLAALHEAAHVIASRRLNDWQTSCGARLTDDGRGGVAWLAPGLTDFARMASVAAGRWGERLTRVYRAPSFRRRPPKPPRAFRAERVRAEAIRELREKAAREACRDAIADAPTVAAWCIQGVEGDPRAWARRFRRVQAAARLAVWQHRDEIRAAALTLFHEGAFELPGDPEQDQCFVGGAVAAGVTQAG